MGLLRTEVTVRVFLSSTGAMVLSDCWTGTRIHLRLEEWESSSFKTVKSTWSPVTWKTPLAHCVQLFTIQWIAALQASLSLTISWSLLKLVFIKSVMPSNYRIICHSLLLLPSIFPSINVFSNGHLFTSGGQSIGTSASVLPMNILGWFPLRLTDLISLLSKGISRVFSSTTVQNHPFFGALPSLLYSSYIHTWLLESP